VGQRFRIISAVGPVYSGAIESMHIEKNVVQKATAGQQAGIKIKDFNKVKIGDLVESYRASASKKAPAWQPGGGVVRKFS
jgi:translation initiation factor IF-2